ncbi:hypothetical protein [Aestuariivirga sp.]|uniref:hypothetical protein n=1 Tax=Aestuariivirga sp. TaxID=2650926 RepID=UPI0039E729C2
MPRYRMRKPQAPKMHPSVNPAIHEEEELYAISYWPSVTMEDWVDTGLLDQHGNKIMRGHDQIGFVRDEDYEND